MSEQTNLERAREWFDGQPLGTTQTAAIKLLAALLDAAEERGRATEIRAAVEEEREGCAVECDEYAASDVAEGEPDFKLACYTLAIAIRDRGDA